MNGSSPGDSKFNFLGKAIILIVCCLAHQQLIAAPANYAQKLPGVIHSDFLDVKQAGERLVAVGERGHIVYSDDGGESWTQARVPTTVMLTRLFFISSAIGWAVGHDGNILITNDSGRNWEMQRHGLTAQADINEKNLGRAKTRVKELKAALNKAEGTDAELDLVEQLDEAEFELEDARAIMEEAPSAPPLMDVWFRDEEHGFAVGAFGTLLYTVNSGREWLDWSRKVDNPDQLHFNGISGSADGKLWIASEWGNVFRSSDWGESWEAVESGYEGSFFGMLFNPASNSVFAYGLRGHIYRSTDDGETWLELKSRARASLFGASLNAAGRMVFVGSGGTVIMTADNGENFTLAMQANQRGLTGAAQLENGALVVSGAGGNQLISLPEHGAAAAAPGSAATKTQINDANPSD